MGSNTLSVTIIDLPALVLSNCLQGIADCFDIAMEDPFIHSLTDPHFSPAKKCITGALSLDIPFLSDPSNMVPRVMK